MRAAPPPTAHEARIILIIMDVGRLPLVRRWVGLTLLVAIAWGHAAWAGDKHSAGYAAALASITVGDLWQHAAYLADDAMEGREAGSRGGRAAGDYLAGQLQRLGLKPAGDGDTYFQPFAPNFRNVLGMLPGGDPTLKDQILVVGGHYDHVGYGNRRNSLGPVGFIHNGADDNASGTAGILELAEAFTLLPEHPKRSILFAFWDAEEKGLLGTQHWLAHPTVPLRQIVFSLDVDMIGRLRGDSLDVFGVRTGYGLRRLLCEQNGDGLLLDFSWLMKPNGDHYTFFRYGIPVLLVSTGEHEQYHRPTDKANLLLTDGMRRISRMLFGLLYELADRPTLGGFREAARQESPETERGLALVPVRLPDRLGAICQDWRGWPGAAVAQIAPGSGAEKAALRPGDRIVQLAGRPVRDSSQLTQVLLLADSPVELGVARQGQAEPQTLRVELEGRPLRLGITWRTDDAEPGTVLLAHVVPDSPAAHAGLLPGDRILQVDGQDFADEADFAGRVQRLPEGGLLLIERQGRLHRVHVRFREEPLKRAA